MIFMSAWSINIQSMHFSKNNVGASYAQMWKYLVKTPEFRDMVIGKLMINNFNEKATCSTYGLYIISSLFALDPWHCITSMIQYLILVPTYINIFNVYAFCNLHDVSWGTKGAGQVESEIPIAKKTANIDRNTEFDIYALIDENLEMKWKSCSSEFIINQSKRGEAKKDKRNEKTKKEDTAKSFRTRIVLLWLSTNALLSIFFTNQASLKAFFPNNNSTVNPYITFLFWSFAGLAFFRFIGSVFYCIENFKERAVDLEGRSFHDEKV